MPAADVKLIVHHERAGNVVGDHAQAVGLVGPGVSEIWRRLTRVRWRGLGVYYADVSETSTVSLAWATVSEKCTRASRPELTTTFCSSRANPWSSTVRCIHPRGTASK